MKISLSRDCFKSKFDCDGIEEFNDLLVRQLGIPEAEANEIEEIELDVELLNTFKYAKPV